MYNCMLIIPNNCLPVVDTVLPVDSPQIKTKNVFPKVSVNVFHYRGKASPDAAQLTQIVSHRITRKEIGRQKPSQS